MFIKHYYYMNPSSVFWNRKEELGRLRLALRKNGFGYVSGRRRVGKTALLTQACKKFGGFYHQAVEGTPEQQLIHLSEEIGHRLRIFKEVVPKSWNEFFRLLSKEKLPPLMVFDEFPYWVQGDAGLPSLFQKWIDHDLPSQKSLILVSGSSQSMLYSQFLQQGSPLYGRASISIRLSPMSYPWFCRALKYKLNDPVSFTRFSLVGGVPHYWKLMPRGSAIRQTEGLYFSPSAILAEEPINWIRDEGISGNLPKALLDLIGRGVAKPSELASRLSTAQGNLSRPLALLLDLGFIHRQMPFGESARSTKKVLYDIQDPPLSFYYGIYLPHRGDWWRKSKKEKQELLRQHTAKQWELFCRSRFPGSGRYWEGKTEIDLVASLKEKKTYLIGECKWRLLGKSEEKRTLETLKAKFEASKLRKKIGKSSSVIFKVFSKRDLSRLSRM
jgi:AAA+ ATPase superfamily predicted ATPase